MSAKIMNEPEVTSWKAGDATAVGCPFCGIVYGTIPLKPGYFDSSMLRNICISASTHKCEKKPTKPEKKRGIRIRPHTPREGTPRTNPEPPHHKPPNR